MHNLPLTPRGIFVPSTMIFHPALPAATLVTWIQLRCLAWRGWQTSPLSLPELASLTGIHPARLQKHLLHLQDISALSIHPVGDGKLVLSFPEHPGTHSDDDTPAQITAVPQVPDLASADMADPPSYFPRRILGYISYQEEQGEEPGADKIGPDPTVSFPHEAYSSEYLLFRY